MGRLKNVSAHLSGGLAPTVMIAKTRMIAMTGPAAEASGAAGGASA